MSLLKNPVKGEDKSENIVEVSERGGQSLTTRCLQGQHPSRNSGNDFTSREEVIFHWLIHNCTTSFKFERQLYVKIM